MGREDVDDGRGLGKRPQASTICHCQCRLSAEVKVRSYHTMSSDFHMKIHFTVAAIRVGDGRITNGRRYKYKNTNNAEHKTMQIATPDFLATFFSFRAFTVLGFSGDKEITT